MKHYYSDVDLEKSLLEVKMLCKLANNDGIVRYNTSWIESPPLGWQVFPLI